MPSDPIRSALLAAVVLTIPLALGAGRAPAEPAHDDPAARDDHDDHGDHDHGGLSDLDRSVEELFAAGCEHGTPAHACDECRWEVGVAKVPADLVEAGLVRTAVVRPHAFDGTRDLNGEIRFDERRIAHLGPRLPGVVRDVLVDLGESVEAGQLLATIDCPELAEVEAAYLSALAEAKLADRTLARQRELREAGISSERELLAAERDAEEVAIRASADRQTLLRLGLTGDDLAALERAGISGASGRFRLKAPFAGEILEMHAVRGERVGPDGELFLLGDTRTLWVWVDVYESQLADLTHAREDGEVAAEVMVRSWPDETFPGRVDFLGRTMDESTRTVKARITLDNPGGHLRPGMFARVRLFLDGSGAGLAVPDAALLSDEGRDFVFVRRDEEHFVRRPVRTGRRADGRVEILAGLGPLQVVASEGAFLLKSDVLRSKMGEGCAH